jgi:hypothetical protein
MLEKELTYFLKVKDELRLINPDGGFVVIMGETILGIWMDRTDAIKSGIEAFGDVPFLVKDIKENSSFKINYTRNIAFPHVVPNI